MHGSTHLIVRHLNILENADAAVVSLETIKAISVACRRRQIVISVVFHVGLGYKAEGS